VSETQEKDKALVRRFLEAQAKGKLNVIDEVLTPTLSITIGFPAKRLTARATSGRSPSITPPSPMSASSSKIR
jgi:hypothetical protein